MSWSERFRNKYGPWALITGASAGIGAEFSRQCAAAGLNVALVARREKRLEGIAAQIRESHGVDTRVIVADLSSEDFIEKIKTAVEGLEIGLLVNNAGFGTTPGCYVESEIDSEVSLLHVNCRANLFTTRLLAPAMASRRRGGLIFVSSIIAFFPAPYWLDYAASKVYLLYMARALRTEMKPFGVDVTALCPGPVSTEFGEVAGVHSPRAASMSVEPVVRAGMRGLGRKAVVVPGLRNKLLLAAGKLLPAGWTTALTGAAMKRVAGIRDLPAAKSEGSADG